MAPSSCKLDFMMIEFATILSGPLLITMVKYSIQRPKNNLFFVLLLHSRNTISVKAQHQPAVANHLHTSGAIQT